MLAKMVARPEIVVPTPVACDRVPLLAQKRVLGAAGGAGQSPKRSRGEDERAQLRPLVEHQELAGAGTAEGSPSVLEGTR